ncbi:Receptor-interacting serine/threonine-protein kinase 1 [Amphibalanus amphitrite]|uniref:Receptor-interacting serine/threonine-protein kinase 1 n=1 Tax=Amphibalanus amphitrite TaxID=1232801 RepID=A0A6A4VMA0_AMPAM|nr:Receptor-interacting serine/threonine-protein kinase 1 [Amphibalanus amphitrite]KAF0294100.1 Receptor-interacting serine/threonine-protein kinase 1 [Amphibalanus amphitrite]
MSDIQSDAVSFEPAMGTYRPMNTSSPSQQAPETGSGGSSVVVHGSSHVHVGSNVTLCGALKKPRPRRPPDSTPQLIALFRCSSMTTDRQLLTASRYIGIGWRDLARRLGFLGAETDDFEYRADSLQEISYRLLRAWREKESSAATVERLAKALWDEEAYDAVVQLAQLGARQ